MSKLTSCVCVCCQEVITTGLISQTQCCLLPICQACATLNQAFSCPNCAATVTTVNSVTSSTIPSNLYLWFQQCLDQGRPRLTYLTVSYQTQLQLVAQHYQEIVALPNRLSTTFNVAALTQSNLTLLQTQLSQLTQTTIKALDLARADYHTFSQQLDRLNHLMTELAAVTPQQLNLVHLETALLINQRLTSLPSPRPLIYPRISLVNHRYGVSVYSHDFQSKLFQLRAAVLKKPGAKPLRVIKWPSPATWRSLIGCKDPDEYFGTVKMRLCLAEWPRPNQFSYLFSYHDAGACLAATFDPATQQVIQIESYRYPVKPVGYISLAHTAFWTIWLAGSVDPDNRVFYHRGLRNQPGDRGLITSPAQIIDIAVCQDPTSTKVKANYILNDDYLYINTVAGLWRKYLPDDQPPVHFSAITKVYFFHYGWYLADDTNTTNDVMGRLDHKGEILSRIVINEVKNVKIFSDNIVAVEYHKTAQVEFYEINQLNEFHTNVDSAKFVWPGKFEDIGFFKISTQGDVFDQADKNNDIVFY